MLDTPQIIQTDPQLIATIHLTVPREDIRKVMGPGISDLSAAVAAQGIAVTGPWFTHHFSRPTEIFDFEICLPVASPVASSGRVKPGQLPAATVARTIYHGPYEGLGSACGEFHAWIAAQGHTPRQDLWECHLAGPESGANPATWRTELNRPLA
jgi:effector-binding domain-containing protein